jgi:RimJ/RimL family protein N-acetyltransferase
LPDAVVRLETERLILDAHRPDDLADLAAMWADPVVVRHFGGHPASRHDSWLRLLRYRGLWPVLGYGFWAVRERATGRFAGDVGFAELHRALDPPIDGLPEAGWALASWAHGRGLAGEAVAAALAWLDRQPGRDRSVCIVAPANRASLRLAERHGFADPVTASLDGAPRLLLTRPRPGQALPSSPGPGTPRFPPLS